uniref:ZAD domain-containing protein n=1 Tax=Anopheles coluzzii TaxID=1518534 RepID=A0A8W7Q2H2_ANOCL
MARSAGAQTMLSVCRFCLCQEEDSLVPIDEVLACLLTLEDVVRFTGIQITENNKASYAMCVMCTDKLKASSIFRSTCLSNDAYFNEISAALAVSAEESPREATRTLDSSMDFDASGEGGTTKPQIIKKANEQRRSAPVEKLSIQPVIKRKETVVENEPAYCSNYIEPGEILTSEEEYGEIDCDDSLSNTVVPAEREKPSAHRQDLRQTQHHSQQRPTCSRTVVDAQRLEQKSKPTSPRPPRPEKLKTKGSAQQHSGAMVHDNMFKTTCNICGKRFEYLKTYQYHMQVHQQIGRSFKCRVCSRVFSRSIGLAEHIRKFHRIENRFNRLTPQNTTSCKGVPLRTVANAAKATVTGPAKDAITVSAKMAERKRNANDSIS